MGKGTCGKVGTIQNGKEGGETTVGWVYKMVFVTSTLSSSAPSLWIIWAPGFFRILRRHLCPETVAEYRVSDVFEYIMRLVRKKDSKEEITKVGVVERWGMGRLLRWLDGVWEDMPQVLSGTWERKLQGDIDAVGGIRGWGEWWVKGFWETFYRSTWVGG